MATASSGEEEEADQETALRSYKDQLAQVEMTMALVRTEEEKAPLLQLVDDLKELIQISEESLLRLKKDNLMRLLDDGGGPSTTATSASHVPNKTSGDADAARSFLVEKDPSPPPPDDLRELYSKYEPLLGSPCRAPYPPGGKAGRHNAIVHSLDGVDEDGRLLVKVLYTHPQEPKMVTCSFFLDDRCRFEDDCRQNHGVVVSASELEDYVEPDFENRVRVGSLCLAKYEADGGGGGGRRSSPLWLPAEVLHLEEGLVTVQIKSVNRTVAVPFDDVFPLVEEESDDSDDTDDDDEDDDDDPSHRSIIDSHSSSSRPMKGEEEEEEEDESVGIREIKVAADLSEFGRWEVATRGIASKLLAKWGYVKGEGLGKDGEGRVVPVEARIFPQGKSLDVCMAMRRRREGGIGDEDHRLLTKKKRERRKRKKGEAAVKKGYAKRTREEESMSAFNFINSMKLTKKIGGDDVTTTTVVEEDYENNVESEGSGGKKQQQQRQQQSSSTKGKSCRDLRVQMLQTEGELSKVEREMEKVGETMKRNEKTNPPVAAQASDKMKELVRYKDKLKRSLKSIQGEEKNRSSKQKLSVF